MIQQLLKYVGLSLAIDRSDPVPDIIEVTETEKTAVVQETAAEEQQQAFAATPFAATPWQFSNVSIHTVEHVDPPKVLTSVELMQRLSLFRWLTGAQLDMLERVTGIEQRLIWPYETTAVEAVTTTARQTLAASGIDPSRLGVLVTAAVKRDFLEPSTAACVHRALGLPPSCICFDVVNACVSLMNGVAIVASMIEAGTVEYGLVVAAEALNQTDVDSTIRRLSTNIWPSVFRDQFAMLTLGGAGAGILLCRSDLTEAETAGSFPSFQGGVCATDSDGCNLCTASLGTPSVISTRPRELLASGLQLSVRCWQYGAEHLGWKLSEDDVIVPHQVSNRMVEMLCEAVGATADQVYAIHKDYGNMGAAGIAVALSKAAKDGTLKPGTTVWLVAVGSGTTCYLSKLVW